MKNPKVWVEKARNAFSGKEYTAACVLFDNDEDILWFGEGGPFIVRGRGDNAAEARRDLKERLPITAAELERLAAQARAMADSIPE